MTGFDADTNAPRRPWYKKLKGQIFGEGPTIPVVRLQGVIAAEQKPGRLNIASVAPLLKKAAASGDAQGMALWAGQGPRQARELPAGQLVEVLAAELEAASTALSAHPKGPSR